MQQANTWPIASNIMWGDQRWPAIENKVERALWFR